MCRDAPQVRLRVGAWRHDAWRAGVIVVAVSFAALSACSDADSTPSPTSAARPASQSPTPASAELPLTATFTNGAGETTTLSIEVADTPNERAVGLMNRESLPQNAGMLFDFQADVQAGFWMKNTLIPLSIAFVDRDGVIVHIEDMEPQTEDLHLSPSLYRYAIEVNQDWYADNGISAGDTVTIEAEE